MKFDLSKSFLDKGTRVLLSLETPFEVVKKAYDLSDVMQTKDRFGNDYKIREDILVRFAAFKKIARLQVEDKIVKNEGVKFSEYFNELNEFESQVKKYVESQEVISASPNDIRFVENQINVKLKYNVIMTQADKMIDFLQDFKDDSTSEDMEDLMTEFSTLVARTNDDFIKLRSSFDDKKKSFSMEDQRLLEDLLNEYIRDINNKSRYVKSGIKFFNDTFGGFEKERFYLFLAASGRGKSVMLLNTAIWAIKYNSYPEVVSAGQIPISLYLTLENTITETLMRLTGYIGGTETTQEFNKGKITPADLTKKINSELINKKDPLNSAKLQIEYRNKGTQSMDDINRIIDDIEADGRHRVVFVAIDYIESIRSDYIKKDDVRMGLSTLGTAFSNLAKDREIPVVSAMQLNRDATQKIEDGTDDVEAYLKSMRNVGASHIAESLKLIQLVDLAIVIDKRKDNEPGKPDSLTFRIVKQRMELRGPTPTALHVHPFILRNGMKMEEDVNDAVSRSVPYTRPANEPSRGAGAPRLTPRN